MSVRLIRLATESPASIPKPNPYHASEETYTKALSRKARRLAPKSKIRGNSNGEEPIQETIKKPVSRQRHNYIVTYRYHGQTDKVTRYKATLFSILEEMDRTMENSYIISIVRVPESF